MDDENYDDDFNVDEDLNQGGTAAVVAHPLETVGAGIGIGGRIINRAIDRAISDSIALAELNEDLQNKAVADAKAKNAGTGKTGPGSKGRP